MPRPRLHFLPLIGFTSPGEVFVLSIFIHDERIRKKQNKNKLIHNKHCVHLQQATKMAKSIVRIIVFALFASVCCDVCYETVAVVVMKLSR